MILRLTLLDYLPEAEVADIVRAYSFAEDAHDGQVRRTGHEYITHPLAVANVLTTMRMDHQSIMAAILHDVLEDTGVSKPTLADTFGNEVAEIVDGGPSKLATIFKSRAEGPRPRTSRRWRWRRRRDIRVILVQDRPTGFTTCARSA